ncbi:hypothetical protein FRAHR75_1440004 [Frankia sp. Hr75.2]|nr:hypothetical protein FRAHR75_1440004 [Frankia sp. Hr75.2]SQD99847.1 hypothetical protein FMEAI12_5720006 [Parafrankia sp. Ea1.12]
MVLLLLLLFSSVRVLLVQGGARSIDLRPDHAVSSGPRSDKRGGMDESRATAAQDRDRRGRDLHRRGARGGGAILVGEDTIAA